MVLFSFWKTPTLFSIYGFWLDQILFYEYWGKFYSFEIFSIGILARTTEKGRGKYGELSNCIIALEWNLCTYNFFAVKEYLTHIVGV